MNPVPATLLKLLNRQKTTLPAGRPEIGIVEEQVILIVQEHVGRREAAHVLEHERP